MRGGREALLFFVDPGQKKNRKFYDEELKKSTPIPAWPRTCVTGESFSTNLSPARKFGPRWNTTCGSGGMRFRNFLKSTLTKMPPQVPGSWRNLRGKTRQSFEKSSAMKNCGGRFCRFCFRTARPCTCSKSIFRIPSFESGWTNISPHAGIDLPALPAATSPDAFCQPAGQQRRHGVRLS